MSVLTLGTVAITQPEQFGHSLVSPARARHGFRFAAMKAAVGYLAVSPDRDGIFIAVGASRRLSWEGMLAASK